MKEFKETVSFDRWILKDDQHMTLESPMATIGSGHIESYVADPEHVFEGLGIPIKDDLPDEVIRAFHACEQRGEKVHVQVVDRNTKYDFVLTHRQEHPRYPWRLIKE